MGAIASQINSLTSVYSTVYSGADQRKHQSSAPLAFVWGIPRWPVNSPQKWPVTRKMFPFDDVIMHCWDYIHCVPSLGGVTATISIHREAYFFVSLYLWIPSCCYIMRCVRRFKHSDLYYLAGWIVIFQIWRSSRHSRLPHRRAHCESESAIVRFSTSPGFGSIRIYIYISLSNRIRNVVTQLGASQAIDVTVNEVVGVTTFSF